MVRTVKVPFVQCFHSLIHSFMQSVNQSLIHAITWKIETLLTVESLWLSGRASECRIRRSEVRFLMRNQKFLFGPTLVTRQQTSFSIYEMLNELISSMLYQSIIWATMSKAGLVKKSHPFMAGTVINESSSLNRLLCPIEHSDLNHILNKRPE